jgi:hypothetical protein
MLINGATFGMWPFKATASDSATFYLIFELRTASPFSGIQAYSLFSNGIETSLFPYHYEKINFNYCTAGYRGIRSCSDLCDRYFHG